GVGEGEGGGGGEEGGVIEVADERRLVADAARAMARAWAVGDATVERHADEADVDLIEPHAVGEAEEGGNSAIARLQLRIGQFRIAPNLLHHAEAPFGKDLPVVNAERPVSVEQSLAAWLMSGTAKACPSGSRSKAARSPRPGCSRSRTLTSRILIGTNGCRYRDGVGGPAESRGMAMRRGLADPVGSKN